MKTLNHNNYEIKIEEVILDYCNEYPSLSGATRYRASVRKHGLFSTRKFIKHYDRGQLTLSHIASSLPINIFNTKKDAIDAAKGLIDVNIKRKSKV